MKNFLPILTICCFIITSCQQGDTSAKQISQLNNSDIFLHEFPQKRGLFDSSLYNYIVNREKELNLTSLDKGFDSIQIRISYGGSFVGERLVILSNKDNKWTAEVSKIITSVNRGFEDSLNADFWDQYSLTRTIHYKMPKSGWSKFIKKLFNLNILTLPDEANIKDFSRMAATDGSGILVEVATKNIYRAYTYGEMDSYNQNHSEMMNISQILKFVDEELGLDKLWDYTMETPSVNEPSKPIKFQEMTIQEVAPIKKKKRN